MVHLGYTRGVKDFLDNCGAQGDVTGYTGHCRWSPDVLQGEWGGEMHRFHFVALFCFAGGRVELLVKEWRRSYTRHGKPRPLPLELISRLLLSILTELGTCWDVSSQECQGQVKALQQ